MVSKLRSAARVGAASVSVEVEVDLAPGLPGTILVGLPNAALRESRDRIRSAIRNSGFRYPDRKIIVNLAPADLRKEGPCFDLPIALAILEASNQLPGSLQRGVLVLGELGLRGEVRPVRGLLAVARARSRTAGASGPLVIPAGNAGEAELVDGLRYLPVATLREAAEAVSGLHAPRVASPAEEPAEAAPPMSEDFGEIRGQAQAKRAALLAAAGGHNLLLVGPPGSGKTLIARRLPGLLPPLSREQALEVTLLHGLVAPGIEGLVRRPPFRAPHHTISYAGLVGGGPGIQPGELSLAHRGVLFLDEMGEFPARFLEMLRQPIEEGEVRLGRAGLSVRYPADVMVVAAMNPCPCGFRGSSRRECVCTPHQVYRYRSRVSGPLLDRFDLQVEVGSVPADDLAAEGPPSSESAGLMRRIEAARELQAGRFAGRPFDRNARIPLREIDLHCALGREERSLYREALRKLGLSARAGHRVLRVSRTAADLDGAESIASHHLSEVLQYRFRGLRED
jgi:magnesium chelatase family protein